MPSDPTLLAFDTSAAQCAAALLVAGHIATRVDPMARGQAEHLMPMLEQMLAEAGIGWRDLDGIGVGIGPGNFTGIRIAVSAARGLALGLGRPSVGVSAFDTTAALTGSPRTAVPAPRDQAYLSEPGTPPRLVALGDLGDAALSSDLTAEAHIAALARLAVARLGDPGPRPAPLYVRPADAAPARDAPPVLIDG